jgi:hypothetical protein
MDRKLKISISVSIFILLTAGVAVFYFVQPLAPTSVLEVIYGEGEDFFSDALVYNKTFDKNVFYLYLPSARAAHRWWVIDFNKPMIYASGPVRTLPFKRRYVLRDAAVGPKIEDRTAPGDWYWHFTQTGAAFSGNGFSCAVKRLRK